MEAYGRVLKNNEVLTESVLHLKAQTDLDPKQMTQTCT